MKKTARSDELFDGVPVRGILYRPIAPASGKRETMKRMGDFRLVFMMRKAVKMLETMAMPPGIMLYRIVWKVVRPNPFRMRGPKAPIPPDTRETQKTRQESALWHVETVRRPTHDHEDPLLWVCEAFPDM